MKNLVQILLALACSSSVYQDTLVQAIQIIPHHHPVEKLSHHLHAKLAAVDSESEDLSEDSFSEGSESEDSILDEYDHVEGVAALAQQDPIVDNNDDTIVIDDNKNQDNQEEQQEEQQEEEQQDDNQNEEKKDKKQKRERRTRDRRSRRQKLCPEGQARLSQYREDLKKLSGEYREKR